MTGNDLHKGYWRGRTHLTNCRALVILHWNWRRERTEILAQILVWSQELGSTYHNAQSGSSSSFGLKQRSPTLWVGSPHQECYPPYSLPPLTCSWDPTPSADLSVGNPGSFSALWNYSINDNNNNGEHDYSWPSLDEFYMPDTMQTLNPNCPLWFPSPKELFGLSIAA